MEWYNNNNGFSIKVMFYTIMTNIFMLTGQYVLDTKILNTRIYSEKIS